MAKQYQIPTSFAKCSRIRASPGTTTAHIMEFDEWPALANNASKLTILSISKLKDHATIKFPSFQREDSNTPNNFDIVYLQGTTSSMIKENIFPTTFRPQ